MLAITENTEIKNIIEKIATELSQANLKYSGLFTGNIGKAIFFGYYYHYNQKEKYLEHCISIVENAFNDISRNNYPFSFAYGVSGVAWAVQHLSQMGILDIEPDIFEDITPPLLSSISAQQEDCNYDLMTGFIGESLYFKANEKNKAYNKITEQVIESLSKNASKLGSGIGWRDIEYEATKEDCFNFGLAHGQPSIIAYLARLILGKTTKETCKAKLKEILKYAINGLLSFKRDNGISAFANSNLEMEYESRLGWCHGDLGVGYALVLGAIALNDYNLQKQAEDICVKTTKRKNKDESFVADAGICHGSSGIALIYKHLFKLTANEIFADNYLYWIKWTLHYLKNNKQLFPYSNGLQKKEPRNLNFLEGIAGTGLVLISSLSEQESKWDECLLLR